MSNSLFRKNSRSSRILDLVEQNNKTPENSHQLTQSLSVEEDRHFKSDSPLPPNCNLGEDDFAVLESMIDEELSQDRTCTSESLIIVPGTPPKKVSRSSFGSFILDSNDNTPLPSPMADFDSNTQMDQNDVVTSQIEEGSSVCPSPTPVVPCVMPPSIDSLITCSPSECDSPIHRNGKRKATYKVNPGKKRSRRVENWIDTKRKTLLNSGQEYTSRDGKVRGSKKLGPVCPSTCKLECFRKFSTATRENIHTQFWKLANHSKQWEYINKFSEKHNKRRLTTEGPSRRQFTSKYFLPLPSEEFPTSFERVPVCLKMFTSTLSITDQFIRTAHSKLNQEGATLPDNRGKHGMHPIKIDESMKRSVCDHISFLQPVESHYTRKSSAKLYLDGNLTMNKLTELYKEWDQLHNYENTIQTVRQYRDIVNEKMNIAFHVPKKDLCDKCHAFFSDKNPTEEQIEMHSKHIENKTTARQFKENDKRLAQDKCPEVVCATFDFQKILTSPHGDVGLFYYKRKLSVYHFTVFDLAKKEAWCYMWTEYTAKRGANEVSSCLKHFMKNKIDEGAKSFLFWSDNCSGQNRNRVVYSMYMLMSQKHNVDITHRFLEQGHTQNEGDSVHALIERESKGKIIYTPDQWYALVRWAKTNGPSYKVIEVAQEDIFDFKPLLADRNWKKDTANENICWNKLKEIKVKKEEHNCLYLKYNFQADSHCLKTLQQTRRKRRINGTVEIKNLYSDVLPLPEAKYKDLMALCKAKLIPTEYHRFFQNLKHGGSTNTDIDSDISEE